MRKGSGKFQNRNKYGANRGIHSVWDIGRLKPVEGVPEVVSSPKSIAELMWRERQALEAQKLAEQRERDNAARIEYDGRLAAFWSQPVGELVGRLGMRDDYCPLEACESEPTAGRDFLDGLTATGVTLSTDAKNRLAAYCESQNKHSHGRIGVAVKNLKLACERLQTLGCFADGEVTEPAPVAATPQLPTLGELFARANNSPTADRELRSVIAEMVRAEYRDVLEAWQRSVYDNFGHRLTETQVKEAWRFVQDHNLNPLTNSSWDLARVNLVHRCLAPQSLLTCREVLDDQLRSGEVTAREYHHRCYVLSIDGVLDKPRSFARSQS
jgi:hypothetical protein